MKPLSLPSGWIERIDEHGDRGAHEGRGAMEGEGS